MKLCIPEDCLKQHLVVLGKTGAGKSSALRHIVEHLLHHKKRVCIVDPKGDWAGLKSSADGKSPGFSIVGFGDFKMAKGTDVPINAQSGKHVAELIASGNRPAIIGFRGWMTSHMVKFWIDFASTLFNANSGELYLVGDEFHNFAPKGKIMDPESGKCLHWSNRLMSEGRGYGLVCLIASQRPQKVHNDTLTCCETLVAMRVIHKADRDAVQDWIEGCGDITQGKVVLNSLAGMARGEAFVWSPEIGFGPERVKFPMFETFDSFAPPQLQKKISDAGWAGVDLDDVKKKLALVIQEVEANDPALLKRQIAEVKKKLESRAPAEIEKEVIKEISVVTPDDVKEIGAAARMLDDVVDGVKETLRKLMAKLDTVSKVTMPNRVAFRSFERVRPIERAAISKPKSTPIIDGEIDANCHKILNIVRMLRARGLTPNREMIARWLDIHPNGGRYGSNLARLRELGFLDGFELTDIGEQMAHDMQTGFDAAMEPLDGPQQQIMNTLASGEQFSREALAKALDIHPNGGRYGSSLARLRTMGLVPERGPIKLTEAALK